jgi:hypothetical protein
VGLYAIKALKKQSITYSRIFEIFAEKEALILTSGYAFITTLHSCFQNKGMAKFFILLTYFQAVVNTEVYCQCENIRVFLCTCGPLY